LAAGRHGALQPRLPLANKLRDAHGLVLVAEIIEFGKKIT
jgi:hypothetical protein